MLDTVELGVEADFIGCSKYSNATDKDEIWRTFIAVENLKELMYERSESLKTLKEKWMKP